MKKRRFSQRLPNKMSSAGKIKRRTGLSFVSVSGSELEYQLQIFGHHAGMVGTNPLKLRLGLYCGTEDINYK